MGDETAAPAGDRAGGGADLERALQDVGTRLRYPPTPEISAGVRSRIDQQPGRRRLVLPTVTANWWRPVLLTVAVILILAVISLRVVPGVRNTVADHIGLPGVIIQIVGVPEGIDRPAAGENLLLGERVSRAQAEARADFELALPTADGLDSPEFYVLAVSTGIMATTVYPPGPDLPDTSFPGVGAVLSQFEGAVAGPMIQKSLAMSSQEPLASLEVFSMNGSEAYWIQGPAHAFFYTNRAGEVQTDTFRLAQNVLLWQRGSTTLRLESAMTKTRAIAMAETIEPVGR